MIDPPHLLHPLLRHVIQLLRREARLLLPLLPLRLSKRHAVRQQAGGHRREYGPTHHGSFLIHAGTFSRPDANGNRALPLGLDRLHLAEQRPVRAAHGRLEAALHAARLEPPLVGVQAIAAQEQAHHETGHQRG